MVRTRRMEEKDYGTYKTDGGQGQRRSQESGGRMEDKTTVRKDGWRTTRTTVLVQYVQDGWRTTRTTVLVQYVQDGWRTRAEESGVGWYGMTSESPLQGIEGKSTAIFPKPAWRENPHCKGIERNLTW